MRIVWFIIKSLFLMGLLTLIAYFYQNFFLNIKVIEEVGLNYFVFFPLLLGLFTWIINKILGFICIRNPLVYWLFTFIIALVMFILVIQENLDNGFDLFIRIFCFEMLVTFFLIPNMGGEITPYLVGEGTISGDTISFRAWREEQYTPGWAIKFGTQLVISGIIGLIYLVAPSVINWILFILQGGFTLVLVILNIKALFEN